MSGEGRKSAFEARPLSRSAHSPHPTTPATLMTTRMNRLLSPRALSHLLPSQPLLVRLSSSLPPAATPLVRPTYTLPNGLVMTGIVTQAGKMSQTTTVTVEHRKTHPKTLKVSPSLFSRRRPRSAAHVLGQPGLGLGPEMDIMTC